MASEGTEVGGGNIKVGKEVTKRVTLGLDVVAVELGNAVGPVDGNFVTDATKASCSVVVSSCEGVVVGDIVGVNEE